MIYFINHSRKKGEWDLKAHSPWKRYIDNEYILYFKNKKITPDSPGNIHFGYVGSLLFSQEILVMGAGFYQIYTDKQEGKSPDSKNGVLLSTPLEMILMIQK